MCAGRQTGGAHPSVGREAGALFRLCAAERELAGKPLTPDAGRQNGSTRARRLHESRRQFRFTGLAKQVGVTLAVVRDGNTAMPAFPGRTLAWAHARAGRGHGRKTDTSLSRQRLCLSQL